jgi:hypothetical protein
MPCKDVWVFPSCFTQWANQIVRPSAFDKVICSEDFMLKEDPAKNPAFRLRLRLPNQGEIWLLASSHELYPIGALRGILVIWRPSPHNLVI